jgi:5-methylthioadenosine/S-adenosylhomocysteine deaminase
MPGLIDTHTHLFFTLGKGLVPGNYGYGNPWIQRCFDFYSHGRVTRENHYVSCLLSCAEMIRGGTTTFVDCPTLSGLESETVEAVTKSGMRGILGLGVMDIFEEPGYVSNKKRFGSPEDNLRRVEADIKKFNKAADGRIGTWGCIMQTPNCSAELGTGLKKLVDKYGVGITVHANVMRPMTEVVVEAFGKTDILRLHDQGVLDRNCLIAHAAYQPGKDMAVVRETGASLAHCIFTSMGLAYGASLFANFPALVDMGVNVGIGTDGVTCCNHKDMVRVMNATFLVNKEGKFDCNLWPPETVVEMATLNGAKAALMENEIGSLEAGKRADIILFDLMRPEWVPFNKYNLIENLVLSATGASVETSIINGEVVMEGYEIKKFNEMELLEKAQKLGETFIQGVDFLGPEKPYPENMPPLW